MSQEQKLINLNGSWLAKPMTEAEILAEFKAGRKIQYASKPPVDDADGALHARQVALLTGQPI